MKILEKPCSEPVRFGVKVPNFVLKMNAPQREYLRNARKAVKIANDVKFNAFAYNMQVSWAESYWHNYLKSTGSKQFKTQMERLREFLVRKDTAGALRYLE